MNKIKLAVIGLAATLLAGVEVKAQSVTNAPSFIDSVIAYTTSSNTNFDFSTVKLDIETGYRQANGTGASSFAKLGYYVTPTIQLNAEIGYFGVGSPINSFEAGVGYALYQNYDIRITAELNGGYDDNIRAGVIEPGIEAKKMLTTHTYAGIGLYLPYYVGQKFNTSPTFTTSVGATF